MGPVAALATIDKMIKTNVSDYARKIGLMLIDSFRTLGKKHGLPVKAEGGMPCLAHFEFEHEMSQSLITLYIRLMLDRGFLAGASTYVTLAHTPEIVEKYSNAMDEVFGEIAKSLEKDTVLEAINGETAYFGFKRLL